MIIKVKKYDESYRELPISERKCVDYKNNNNICDCNVYSGDYKLPILFNHI